MSILEKNTLDGVALTKDKKTLALMISDHLPWDNEYEHLTALQEKLNSYIVYWQSGQYKNIRDAKKVKNCVVEIYFMHEPTENAYRFLETVNQQIAQINMRVAVCEE